MHAFAAEDNLAAFQRQNAGRTLISVDLPAPLSPISATTSPG
jgi:hypothetical protein